MTPTLVTPPDDDDVEDGRLVLQPLAILINTPSSSSSSSSHHSWNVPAPQTATPVFTRRDDVGDQYSDWLVAKMWVRVAHVHYHMLGSLITSRLLAETISLAVYRCLPSVHPVSCTSLMDVGQFFPPNPTKFS